MNRQQIIQRAQRGGVKGNYKPVHKMHNMIQALSTRRRKSFKQKENAFSLGGPGGKKPFLGQDKYPFR